MLLKAPPVTKQKCLVICSKMGCFDYFLNVCHNYVEGPLTVVPDTTLLLLLNVKQHSAVIKKLLLTENFLYANFLDDGIAQS